MDLLLKQNLLLMIRALYFCVEEKWAELGKNHNISPAQQHVLFLLYSSKSKILSPSELSDLGGWHISTVSRLIKPMENRGFITITPDKRPKYKEVKITDSGMILLQDLISEVDKISTFPLDISHLTESEVESFLHVIQKILYSNRSITYGSWLARVKTGSDD
ncbi:MarR family winged helix-turn-helix transcriptional regulator [Sutcliffiella halmapala]|uniref:MarR family winged helix-turn-helix transcriptional regulator n=1 Tax=Sutcliffiella halmapala TaxID=79882 RepID=UPI000994AD05|nr:MarR family transcriptional regulator [Sutcliffiella halmapala]